MSSHEELDQQFHDAVSLDDARDDRMAARGRPSLDEFNLGASRMGRWPKEWRDDLLRMEPNERNWFILAAALLNAEPESEGEAQI